MNNYTKPRNDGSIAFGFIILGIGVILLLRKIGFFIPDWILTWPMILIVIGTFSIIKHEFKSFFGFVILFIGAYFLLKREFDLDFGLGQYVWPLGLIILGIYLITQKTRENKVLEDIRRNWESERKSKTSFSSTSTVEEATIVANFIPSAVLAYQFGNFTGEIRTQMVNLNTASPQQYTLREHETYAGGVDRQLSDLERRVERLEEERPLNK